MRDQVPPAHTPGLSRRAALALGLGGAAGLALGARGQAGQANGWVKSPANPVLSLGAAGAFDSQNIMGPSIVKYNGEYYLYYAGGPSGPDTGADFINYQLGLARSSDGVHFQKTGTPILPLGTRDNFHVTPAPLRDPAANLYLPDDKWHLFYCGNRADDLEHATSTDGVTWTKDPANPIYRAAYAPHMLWDGTRYRLYSIRKPSGKPWEVALATGLDWYSLTLHPDSPVLTLGQAWEKGALFYPYVIKEGDRWILFYASYWNTNTISATATAIGMATSSDGIHWTKRPDNPILRPTPGSSYDRVYTSSQSVIRDGNLYRMFYAGRIDMRHKYYSIGQATHAAPLLTTGIEGWKD